MDRKTIEKEVFPKYSPFSLFLLSPLIPCIDFHKIPYTTNTYSDRSGANEFETSFVRS